MTAARPQKVWWTAAEIAAAALPDLPGSQRGADMYAKKNGWRDHLRHARRRAGKGGGWEYSWELFPIAARRKLLSEAAATDAPADHSQDIDDLRGYYETLPDRTKEKTKKRFQVLQTVRELEQTTQVQRCFAVEQASLSHDVSARTIWSWLKLVGNAPQGDWLYLLAPRNRAAERADKKAACDPEFMARLKSLYLRLEGPTFAQCYRDAVKIAEANGWSALPDRTARRRLNEEVPKIVQVFAREGVTGLEKCFAPQVRDRSELHAMQAVNADCHKFDVFVRWPDGRVDRCQIIAFQDLYSGKILSWKIDHTPNEAAVMMAFGDMVETYGIPDECTFDNGREFAAKWLSGGVKTRYRGKVRDDDPLGVLPLLGIQIHWARPGHGQAKPIERAFRDLASDIAKDVRFAGAYVGNRPDAKPENYGSAAVPIDKFLNVVEERIIEHNARIGRRSDTARGRSFDQTFAESYERSAIRRATDEQKRLWLMGQKTLTMQQRHGRLHLFGNYYWSDWMADFAGRKVVVRFDLEDLHSGAYIYELTGEYMGFAPCQQAIGFYDLTSAKSHARAKAAFRRAQRRALERERALNPKELAAELDAISAVAPVKPEAKIVRMQKGDARPEAARATRPEHHDEITPEQAAQVHDLQERMRAEMERRAATRAAEEPIDRFERAITLERRIAASEPVGEAETEWLARYQTSSEYRGLNRSYEDFGDAMFLR